MRSFVTNGVGYGLSNTNFTGFNNLQMSQINSIAGTVGGLTTNALEFAFTGQTTFNLANLSMLGLEYGSMWGAAGTGTISGGFLSMTVGQNGTHFAISSAGTDISLGTLKLAAAGAKESSKVIDWKYGSVETNSTLNSINMLGYTNIGGNQKLSKDIWNETINVNYTDTGGDYGNYKGGSTINISSTLLGGGAEEYAKLATVLAHEGTHAYSNKIEGVAHSVGLETYTQINQIYDLSGDIDFAAEMIEAIKNPDSWKENTGDTDHWTIAKKDDGTYGWKEDGRLDFYLEDGTKIAAGFLSDYLNGKDFITSTENVEAKDQLIEKLKKSGYSIDEIKKFLEGTAGFAEISLNAQQLQKAIDEGNQKEIKKYLKQMNSAMYTSQNTGLLVKNEPLSINTTNLIGSGTVTNPYFPLAGVLNSLGKPVVSISSFEGWRLDDIEMAGISSNYHLYAFSPYYHQGWDGYGDGKIVASLDGGLYLDYLHAEGFQVNNTTELGTFNSSHANSDSVMQYLNMYGSSGVSMTYDNGNYQLNGIQAGTIIGYIGNTGSASTGAHTHMSLNGSGTAFANIFNDNNYTSNYNITPYAQYMSNYQFPSMNNQPVLWQNVQNYANQRPDLLNLHDFTMNNSEDYMSLFWNKYPRLEK